MRRRDLSPAKQAILREADAIERDLKRVRARMRKAARQERAGALKESAAPNKRQPREHDNLHLAYVRRAPCLSCMVERALQTGPSRAAHVRTGYRAAGWTHTGKGVKPSDWRTLPLCDWCHTEAPMAQHKGRESDFWDRLGIYPPDACAAFVEGLAKNLDPAAVARRLADAARELLRGAA